MFTAKHAFSCFESLFLLSHCVFVIFLMTFIAYSIAEGWLGSRVVSVLDSGAEGPGSNRSRDAVG